MKKLTSTLAALAISLAVLVPAGVASATTATRSGVGEVNLGPIVIPNNAIHWNVIFTYNGTADIPQSIGSPVVYAQIGVEDGPDPANAGPVDPTNVDPANKSFPEAPTPGSVKGFGQLRFCSNACEASFSMSTPTTRYWLIMSVCPADGSGPLPAWTVKVTYTTRKSTVGLPALALGERGGPDGLSDCDGHLT
jgi:hypothetical protein